MESLGFTCLIALDEAVEILPGPLRRAFAYVAPRASFVVQARPPADTTQAFVASVDGHKIVCALFDRRLPQNEYTRAIEKSLFWTDAAQTLDGHRAFIAVTAVEREEAHGLARAQAVAMTRLAAALCEVMPATGVLWHGARTVSSPEAMARAARSLAQGLWPVDVWIGWVSFGEIGGTRSVVGFQTVGAAEFLGFEIQVPAVETADLKEPLRILYGAAGYLMARGNVIRDGQVVEVLGERRVRYQLHLGADGQPGLARLSVIEQDPHAAR